MVDVFSQTASREQCFQPGDRQTLSTGAPVLHSALVSFDGLAVQRLTYEAHTTFLGEVQEIHIPDQDNDPLHKDRAPRRPKQLF